MPRFFRSAESYRSETITWTMGVSFLRERGFVQIGDDRKSFGKNTPQNLRAVSPKGQSMSLRVRLCCPKCHREAHSAPDRDEINRLLPEHVSTTHIHTP